MDAQAGKLEEDVSMPPSRDHSQTRQPYETRSFQHEVNSVTSTPNDSQKLIKENGSSLILELKGENGTNKFQLIVKFNL